jgi:hypothetical protein
LFKPHEQYFPASNWRPDDEDVALAIRKFRRVPRRPKIFERKLFIVMGIHKIQYHIGTAGIGILRAGLREKSARTRR